MACVRVELGKTSHVDGAQPRKELLAAALTRLAESGVDLVVPHDGQNNEAGAWPPTGRPRCARIARVAEDIVNGRIHVPESYEGRPGVWDAGVSV